MNWIVQDVESTKAEGYIVSKGFVIFLSVCLSTTLGAGALADPHKSKELPPGLEKNLERGKPLPPGWQKKLLVGHRLDHDIYAHGRVLRRHDGYVTIGVKGKVIRLIENSLEIVEILDSL